MESVKRVEEESDLDADNSVFVAVGKNVKESRSLLSWAVENFAGKKFCVLHVHQPKQLLSLTGEKLSASKLKQQALNAFEQFERQKLQKLLNEYLFFLAQAGVKAEKIWIDMDNIEKGIVHIVSHHGIKWLVMGAGEDKHHSMKMAGLKSKKAVFVCQQAPASCHIWFCCRGCLIFTRDSEQYATTIDAASPRLLLNSEMGTEQPDYVNPKSVRSRQTSLVTTDPDFDLLYRSKSFSIGSYGMSLKASSCPERTGEPMVLQSHADAEKHATEWDGIFRSSKPLCSRHSTSSKNRVTSLSKSALFLTDGTKDYFSCPTSLCESGNSEEGAGGQASSEIYDRLEKARTNAESSKRKAFEESMKRWEAEENARDALLKAKSSEFLLSSELERRIEMEEVLVREKQDLEKIKLQNDNFMKEIQIVQSQKLELENQLLNTKCTVNELEEKIVSAVELLIAFKEQRDKLKEEHENAVREAMRLKALAGGNTRSLCEAELFAFTFMEINESTDYLDPSRKISEGMDGVVYRGFLRHMDVAIKMLPSNASHSPMRFRYEVEVLSRVRHPNLVCLLGACPETRSIIYEYLINGSLEDQLSSQGRRPPLAWQTRTQIAADICSALVFLHSNKPCIIHGNLKPGKILLDANFTAKVGDFRTSFSLMPRDENSTYSTLQNDANNCTAPNMYLDPEYICSGELTPESDVYSFGVILLQLITGRAALGIVRDVKCALEKDNLDLVVDSSAGNWPLDQAKQLAYLALRCCEERKSNRADLEAEVWPVLELMKELCNDRELSSGSKESRRAPSYFLCPIYQEVMKDPQIAADGYTYEAEAIKGWFNSGRNTSPMTNLKLPNCDLIPNNSLYYAIQEWLQSS